MRVSNIRTTDPASSPDRTRLSADLSYDDRPGDRETLWYEVPAQYGYPLASSGDPWMAALLPLASTLGEPLHIDAPIDPVFLESSRELMEWWTFWFPQMSVIRVTGLPFVPDSGPKPSRTAQFFSGGLDSFFTTLRHADPSDPIQVDDLLYGWGFDIPLADTNAFTRLRTNLSAAAEKFGKRLVAFSSNIRQTRFRELPWGAVAHGCAMTSIALLLERVYGRVLIPSTDGYRETGPWGSHPMVDHYYSTSTTRVIHDGSLFTRFQKAQLVSTSPVALSVIRVCWRSQSDHNCGRCEKCLRTMIALDLCGVLDQAPTFAHAPLDLGLVKQIYCPKTRKGSLQLYYTEMLQEARQRGRHDLADAIQTALRRSTRRQSLLAWVQRLRQAPFIYRFANPLEAALRRSIIT
jgi:hypothetical protein